MAYAAGSRVQSGDLGDVDAPGIAAGGSRHEDLANDALTLTDALLLVPPRLVAGDAERLASLINGGVLHRSRAGIHTAR